MFRRMQNMTFKDNRGLECIVLIRTMLRLIFKAPFADHNDD